MRKKANYFMVYTSMLTILSSIAVSCGQTEQQGEEGVYEAEALMMIVPVDKESDEDLDHLMQIVSVDMDQKEKLDSEDPNEILAAMQHAVPMNNIETDEAALDDTASKDSFFLFGRRCGCVKSRCVPCRKKVHYRPTYKRCFNKRTRVKCATCRPSSNYYRYSNRTTIEYRGHGTPTFIAPQQMAQMPAFQSQPYPVLTNGFRMGYQDPYTTNDFPGNAYIPSYVGGSNQVYFNQQTSTQYSGRSMNYYTQPNISGFRAYPYYPHGLR